MAVNSVSYTLQAFREKATVADVQLQPDLSEAAARLLDFLVDVDAHANLHKGPDLDNAIQRYERFWLPLAAAYPSRDMLPPLDIAWVWYLHMLAPSTYEHDCINVVGEIVSHKFDAPARRRQATAVAQQLWREMYGEEPFDAAPVPATFTHTSTALSLDFVTAAEREATFFYQVSLPHFRDQSYLLRSVKRYKLFLLLRKQHQDTPLAPTCDIGLIWRTHRSYPVEYKAECTSMYGSVWDQCISDTDLSEGSRLREAEERTRELWKAEFGETDEDYICDGGMWRGHSPRGTMATLPLEFFAADPSHYQLTVGDVSLHKCSLPKQYSSYRLTLTWKKKATTVDWPRSATSVVPKGFTVDGQLGDKSELTLLLLARKGHFALSSTPVLKTPVELDTAVAKVPKVSGEHEVQLAIGTEGLSSSISLLLSLRVSWVSPDDFGLTLGPGTLLQPITDSPAVTELYPHRLGVTSERIVDGCLAHHTLYDHNGKASLRARVAYATTPSLAAVQVTTLDGSLLATGHLIGVEQLPVSLSLIPSRRLTWGPATVPGKQERTMLVKDNDGDLYLVKARWETNPLSRADGVHRYGDTSIPVGTITFAVYDVRQNRQRNYSYSSLEFKRFCVENVEVNCQNGFITVRNSNLNTLPSHIALAFSLGMLCSLCCPVALPQPASKCFQKGEKDLSFLNATGFSHRDHIPSNHYLERMWKLPVAASSVQEDNQSFNGAPADFWHLSGGRGFASFSQFCRSTHGTGGLSPRNMSPRTG